MRSSFGNAVVWRFLFGVIREASVSILTCRMVGSLLCSWPFIPIFGVFVVVLVVSLLSTQTSSGCNGHFVSWSIVGVGSSTAVAIGISVVERVVA